MDIPGKLNSDKFIDKGRGVLLLTGIPGCGKTAVGKLLADSLRVPFLDLDSWVEETTGMKIEEIFAKEGEKFFRGIEIECLKEIIESEGELVLSLGGGALESGEAMPLIRRDGGLLIWLKVEPDIAAERLVEQDALDERPLLKGYAPVELGDRLRELQDSRWESYLFSDFAVDTDILTLKQVVERIREILPTRWTSEDK